MAARVEIHPREPALGARVDVLTLDPPPADMGAVAARLADPVLQVAATEPGHAPVPDGTRWLVEIGFLPGVTDNRATTAREVLRGAGLIGPDARAHSSRLYATAGEPHAFAAARHNPLIERARVASLADYLAHGFPPLVPEVRLTAATGVLTVALPEDPGALRALSAHGVVGPEGSRGPLGLSVADFEAIRAHFAGLGRDPTDVEIETLAQSWSEHCKHRLFAATIEGDVDCPDGLFRTFVARTTEAIMRRPDRAGFCISVFDDNAGAIAFDDEWMVCDKVETHNSPSALDPYGGAMTGIVGVNRDCLGFGLGARPIANRYGFCLGMPGDARPLHRDADRTNPLPSVDRIMHGVVEGVEDGGNQSGIPTCQGFVIHDDSYRGKPLVFCGTLGLLPRRLPDGREAHVKRARAGDRVVMAGGRVGKDGIHGATFSSVALDATSPATAVQIGDPITQKRMSDAVLEARDAGLYTSITDNGAGGLSSSVGEMARESGGARIDLDAVPLKYPGLAPWEVWVSEAQERMTLAVPPGHVDALVALFARHGVEATAIGAFTDDGMVTLRHGGEMVGALALGFLHGGAPRLRLTARAPARPAPSPLPAMPDLSDAIPRLLATPDLASRAALARRYDHEVQSTSLVKPLQGRGQVKGDATAIAPVPGSPRAVGLTEALLPHLTERDPHACAVLTVDLAVRRLAALGVDPHRMALLDNICWSSPDEPERAWLLHETMRGAAEAALHFGAPFVSGKDSMHNDFRGYDADGPLHVAALPTLLISALGIMERRHATTMDAKVPGDVVALMGRPDGGGDEALGGSAWAQLMGWHDAAPPPATLTPPDRLAALAGAIAAGDVASALAVGPGGLGVALARACMAGRLGATIDLAPLGRRRADQTLFREGGGQVLLTMAPDAFERHRAALDLAALGTVTEAPCLVIEGVAVHELADLARAHADHPLGGAA